VSKGKGNRASRRRQARQKVQGGQRQSWKWLLLVAVVVFVGYGVWSYRQLPDTASAAASFGLPAQGTEVVLIEEAVSMVQASPDANLTVQGRVVDMGPTMGCWLVVRDGTGEVMVQTDPMVYMPQGLPGETVQATGRLVYGRFRLMGKPGNYEGWLLLTPGVEVVTPS
jgi:RNase P/RNase MRP subunit p29